MRCARSRSASAAEATAWRPASPRAGHSAAPSAPPRGASGRSWATSWCVENSENQKTLENLGNLGNVGKMGNFEVSLPLTPRPAAEHGRAAVQPGRLAGRPPRGVRPRVRFGDGARSCIRRRGRRLPAARLGAPVPGCPCAAEGPSRPDGGVSSAFTRRGRESSRRLAGLAPVRR